MGNIVLNQIQGLDYQIATTPFHEIPLELGVQMNSAGYELREIPNEYDWDGLERGDNQIVLLQYTLDGTGCLHYENQEHLIKAGQLMLLCIPHQHRYFLPKNHQWEHMYITSSGTETWRIAQHLIDRHGPLLTIDPFAPCIQSMARLVRLCIEHRFIDSLHASQLFYQCLLELVQLDEHHDQHPDYQKIQASMQFAQEQLAQDIGIKDMSRVATLSRHHYSRKFKDITGMSPGQWLNQQRIKYASKLLIESDHSMSEIALRCGIPDVNYFGKVFKRIQGISPGQFRDSGLYG